MPTLQEIADSADKIVLCSALPTTYDEADTQVDQADDDAGLKLGEKVFGTGLLVAEIAEDGLSAVMEEFIDGEILCNGDATHWAILDSYNQVLMATGSLPATKTVVAGNAFAMELTFDNT